MAEKIYTIDFTQPTVYLDRGSPVQGFLIQGTLLEFDEIFQINVPKMDEKDIDKRILTLLEQRRKLANLGNGSE